MGQSLSSLPPSQIANVMNETDVGSHEIFSDYLAGDGDEMKQIMVEYTDYILIIMSVCMFFLGTLARLMAAIHQRRTNDSELGRRDEGRDDLVGFVVVVPAGIIPTAAVIEHRPYGSNYNRTESIPYDDHEEEQVVESFADEDLDSESYDDDEVVESNVVSMEVAITKQEEVENDDKDDKSSLVENDKYGENDEEEAEIYSGGIMEREKDNDEEDLISNLVNEDDNVEICIDVDMENSEDDDDDDAGSNSVQSTTSTGNDHQVVCDEYFDDDCYVDPFDGLKPKTTSLFCWGGHEEDGKKMVTRSKTAPIDEIRFIEDVMLNVYSFLPYRERIVILPSVDKKFLRDPARCGFAWPHKCVTIGSHARTTVALHKFGSALTDQSFRVEREFGLRERQIDSEPSKRKRYRLRRKLKKERKCFNSRYLKLSKLYMELNKEWYADELPFVKAEEKFEFNYENIYPFPIWDKYHEYDVLTERIREANCEQEFQKLIVDHGIDWNDHDMGSLKSRTSYFLPDAGGGVKRFELLQCYGCSKCVPYDQLGCRCNDHQHFECKTCFQKKAEDKNQALTRYGGTCPMCLHDGHVPLDWDDWSSGEGPRYRTGRESDFEYASESEDGAEDWTWNDESDDDLSH